MKCKIKRCNRDSVIIYYGNEICDYHWSMHCSGKHKFDLKRRLNIDDKKVGQMKLV